MMESPLPPRRPGAREVLSPRLWILSVVCATVIAAGCTPAETPAPDAWAGSPLDGSVAMPADTLPTMEGETFALADETEGGVTLLFIGYTYCPDVCPVHLANLAAVLRDLPLEMTREITTVFVTADPVRDTPQRLQEWLGALHSDFVGLRPTREGVNALEDALALPRSVVDPGEGPDDYFVGHAGQVLAFDRNGVARVAYPWGIRQRDWRRDLPRMVAGRWPEAPAADGGR